MQVTFEGIPHTPPSPEQLDEWKAQCLSKFPSKIQYQVILADPPWNYKSKGTSVRGKPPYPTMSLKELKALPVPSIAASTCVLFLWATCPLLPDALELVTGWGFTYKAVFKVWLKRARSGKEQFHAGPRPPPRPYTHLSTSRSFQPDLENRLVRKSPARDQLKSIWKEHTRRNRQNFATPSPGS